MSYGHHSDDNSTARHSQFIAAIGSQISRVEATLRESFLEEGKLPPRWVNLDEDERDDLAAFLSGTPQITQSAKDECVDVGPSTKSSSEESHLWIKDTDLHSNAASKRNTLDEIVCVKDESPMNKNVNYAMELEGKEILGSRDDIIGQADRTTNSRRTWSTPNFGALKIVIADVQRNKSISGLENTPKEKGSKFVFWKKRCGELSRTTGTVNLFNQVIIISALKWTKKKRKKRE